MRNLKRTVDATIAIGTSLALALPLCACNAQQESETSSDGAAVEETIASFNAHGSEFGKTEKVNVTTDLQGNLTDIAVEETIANPKEKATIKDKSSLNAISFDEDDLEGASYTQDGENLTWTTNGKDITYTGTTDKPLPFTISYDYKLNGKEIAPEDIKNVSGKLKVTINYTNNADATIKVDGEEKQVKLPYMFASLMTLDPEHARKVKVKQGTCITMNGQQIAVGVAAPGLKKTLGLSDEDLDLGFDLSDMGDGSSDSSEDGGSFNLTIPDKVTITAEVVGFDMPSVTTMATDSLLSKVAGNTDDLTDKTDGVFSSLGTLVSAIGKIGTANDTIAGALDKISGGEKTMGEKLPQVSEGLSNMSILAGGIQKQAEGAASALEKGSTGIDSSLATLQQLLQDQSLTEEQRSQLTSMVQNLTIAKQTVTAASGILSDKEKGTAVLAGKLSTGLTTASSGISQLSTGVSAFSTALGKLQAGLEKLAGGSSTMSKKLTKALDKVQDLISEKSSLIKALGDYVDDRGAYCGSASDMPASTTFTITAKAQD